MPDAERRPGQGAPLKDIGLDNQGHSSPDEARKRVQAIRGHVEDIVHLIIEAYRSHDWQALGYPTWDANCTTEFGGVIAIPRNERGDLVFTLRQAGMSTRAIGSAINVDHKTVVNDLQRQGGENSPPAEIEGITGIDGKRYPGVAVAKVHEPVMLLGDVDPARLSPFSARRRLSSYIHEMENADNTKVWA